MSTRSILTFLLLALAALPALAQRATCPSGEYSLNGDCLSVVDRVGSPQGGAMLPPATGGLPESSATRSATGTRQIQAPAAPSPLIVVPRDRIEPQQAPVETETGVRRGEDRLEFQELVSRSTGKDLPLFGHEMFGRAPSTFAPLDRVPVTSDYVVGPGDELHIRIWGQVDADIKVEVDPGGSVFIPRVGQVSVAGVRQQELSQHLSSAVGRVFRNFELSASLGRLRAVQVFVVGYAVRPGVYTVSSLSTLANAVFAAGGPSVRGSMRRIQLKRADRVVTEFDLYDLLLHGNKAKDARLQAGDVISIPPVGPLVAVTGSVTLPAIYELKGDTSFADAIALAGGLSNTARTGFARVERISGGRARSADEITLEGESARRPARDGDIIAVLSVLPRFENAVTLRGNVADPGRYPWREGLRVRDLVPERDSLVAREYWLERNRLVLAAPDTSERRRPPAESGAPPESRKRLDVRSGEDVAASQGESAGAEPRRGDRGPRGQEALRNEIKRMSNEINWDYAVIERLDPGDLSTTLIPFHLGKAVIDGDPQHNVLLRAGDVVTVFSKDDIPVPVSKQSAYVRIDGESMHPGLYQARPGETLRQLLARVGGLSPDAYLFGASFARESARLAQEKQLREYVERFERDVDANLNSRLQRASGGEDEQSARIQAEAQRNLVERLRQIRPTGRIVLEVDPDASRIADLPDIPLEDGDHLHVPRRPATVSVLGAVFGSNTQIHRPEKRAADYLAQSGGATATGDEGSIYVLRADGSVRSRRQDGWSGGLLGLRLSPGDALIVPDQLDRFRLGRELKDWAQIFYQLSLGVAGLAVLRDL